MREFTPCAVGRSCNRVLSSWLHSVYKKTFDYVSTFARFHDAETVQAVRT